MNDQNTPKNFSTRPLIFALIVLLVILAGVIWYWSSVSTSTTDYLTATVTKGDIEEVVTAYGVIQPLEYVDIGAQVSGILKNLHVNYGDDVKKDDLLVEIDDAVYISKVDADKANVTNLQAQLETKKAQLILAELQNKRTQELFKEKAISEDAAQTNQSNYDQAVANVAALNAQIEQAQAILRTDEANLTYTKILAPMNGTIVNLIARQGQTLNANQTAPIILRLADLDVMTVWAQVSEADVPKLKPGLKAYFNTLGQLDKRLYGNIRIIYPTPEVITGAIFYDVLFDVDNKDHSLLPQMSAQVFFVINEAKDVLLVPVVALSKVQTTTNSTLIALTKDESTRNARIFQVQVLKDNKVETRKVVIGVTGRINAEVISGLSEGEKVVIGNKNSSGTSPAISPTRTLSPSIPGGR